MVLLKKVNFDDPSYPLSSFESEWINLEGSKYVIYTVYCSEDCDIQISWSFDDQFQVCDVDTVSLTGGTSQEQVLLSKNLFARFEVQSIASTPSDLKVQLFFFN